MIKYHNANDVISGRVTGIGDVTAENRASMQFSCLGCGKEMVAVLGKSKEHHFRHKEVGDCNSETYLHRLGKRVLKNKFDTQPKFLVKYYVQNECQKFEQCKLRERHHWQDCNSVVLKTVNLKEFYDICEEEIYHKGFKADLKLSHSEYPDRNPVFLEVSVSHDCTPEKIDSGIRIIEIKINHENDAYGKVVENKGGLAPESPMVYATSYFGGVNQQPPPSPIKFYNFKRKDCCPTHNFSKFYLTRNDDGIYRAAWKTQTDTCQCTDFGHEENACFEVTISEDKIPKKQYGRLYLLGLALAHKRGLGVKSCTLCINYRRCITSLDCWVEHPPDPEPVLEHRQFIIRELSAQSLEILQPAYSCACYRLYERSCQKQINSFSDTPYWVWTDGK